ncbi:serine protease, partial [Phycicoccus elongatus]|uniref:serine protease n=1 Tax=Phycicoccus elongatus TaxID=101689 RepID=UPI002CE9FD50
FGTGFVVNAEGYLVTAAHVIAPDPDELKVEFARAGLRDLIANDLDEVQASGVAYSPANLDTLAQAFQDWYVRYLEVGEVSTTVSAQIGVATAGVDKTQRGQPAEIIKVGAPYPGKDVAVLKLDGAAHLPTLPLGDDADVPEGSTLHVTGYPAASTFSSGMSADSQVQPTITEGPLTAIKKTETGMPVFQTQAPASPGNSGGPVLDDAGNVVGILVASAVADDGTALEGQEFVIPISVVRQMLNETNVKPGESATTQAYNVALGAYFDKYYKRAMPEFQRVQALYPEHPYVAEYITRTQQAIDAGKDETPNSLMLWVALAGGVLMVLAVGGVGGFLLLRKRGKGPAPVAGTAPQGGPWPGYPGPQGHQGIPGHQEIPGQQGYAGQPGFPGQQSPPGQPPQHAHQQPAPAGPMGQPAWPAQPQQPASHPPQPPVTQPLQPPLPSDPLPPPPWHAPGSAPGQQPPPGSPPPVP